MQFDNIQNVRELGGLMTVDGRTVKHNRLFRTAHLFHASDHDIKTLEDLHVCRVLDLRSQTERMKMPDRDIPGAQNIPIEVISLNGHLFKDMADVFNNAPTFEEGMTTFVMTEGAKMLCEGFYPSFVNDPYCQEAYRHFFNELLSAQGGAVLFHCSQGKDRTGFAAAYILSALGVPREEILREFSLSNKYYEKDVAYMDKLVASKGGSEAEFFCIRTLVGVNVDSFIEALDLIDSTYGGMDAFLEKCLGLTKERKELLASYYLD